MKLLLALGMLLIASDALSLEPAPATNFFPIMPWNSAPNDPAVLKKIRECGFTVAGFAAPSTLDACAAAGLKAIVSDARTSGYDWAAVDEVKARQNVSNLVAQVGNHPAVFGYYLRDEPTAPWFANLEKVASAIRDLAPDKWPYINLFPDYADNSQLGTTSYADYLERFITTCHPRIISYDNYSLMEMVRFAAATGQISKPSETPVKSTASNSGILSSLWRILVTASQPPQTCVSRPIQRSPMVAGDWRTLPTLHPRLAIIVALPLTNLETKRRPGIIFRTSICKFRSSARFCSN
jgi:hypothetical protein